MNTSDAAESQDQDRRDDRPRLGFARDARAPDARRARRRAAQLLARRLPRTRPSRLRGSAPPRAPPAGASRSWPTCPGPRCASAASIPSRSSSVPGDAFTLTTDDVVGDAQRVSMSFERLPRVVKPGDLLYLNDGLVQLEVERVAGDDVHCKVVGRRRAALAQGPEPAGHRPRHRRLHRPRPRLPRVRARARRRRREPVVRGDGGGRRGRARRGPGGRPAAVPDREDRARRRAAITSTRSSRRPTASWSRAATSAWRCRSRRSRSSRSN